MRPLHLLLVLASVAHARWHYCLWTKCVSAQVWDKTSGSMQRTKCLPGYKQMAQESCSPYTMKMLCCEGKGKVKALQDYGHDYYDYMTYDYGAEGFIDYKFPKSEKRYWKAQRRLELEDRERAEEERENQNKEKR
uniref:Basic tail protein n=1 Tax=Steinernema glaseri TaxID=37863 RepID=A0A1I7ZP29_9BILA